MMRAILYEPAQADNDTGPSERETHCGVPPAKTGATAISLRASSDESSYLYYKCGPHADKISKICYLNQHVENARQFLAQPSGSAP